MEGERLLLMVPKEERPSLALPRLEVRRVALLLLRSMLDCSRKSGKTGGGG